MNKKVLITGATGFIGRALVSKLKDLGEEVLPVCSSEGRIQNPQTLLKFSDFPIKHIFHLAAKTYIPQAWEHPWELYETNVMGTLGVLELCKTKKIPLTFVSAYVYGIQEKLPITELSTPKPNNPYASSKILAENLCKFYADTYNIQTAVIRPFNVYGIGQKEHFLIPHLIKQALTSAEIVVNDLIPTRDFIYLDDLVEALILTMNTIDNFEIYNIGSGESFSIRQVIDQIQLLAGTSKLVRCENKPRINEILETLADTSKAQKKLNWTPSVNFSEGIKRVLESC
jgi:nucleoside-diphosphate-sugar epimerase